MKSENEYVAEEIRKSGFPLEMEIAELLEARGWEVMPSVFWCDHDYDEYKEIDMLAYNRVTGPLKDSPNYPYAVTIELVLNARRERTSRGYSSQDQGILMIFITVASD